MSRFLVIVVAVFALALSACSSSTPEEPTDTGGTTSGEEVVQPGADEEEPDAAAATVNAIDFAFEPDGVEVAAGQDITFTNDGEVTHTMTLTDTPLGVEAEPGASVTLITGELDAGTYDFVCMFHSQMTGTLTIS